MKTHRSGFTLVELLVVVAVIGLLLALVVPAVQGARESARRLQCVNQLKQLGIALARHHEQKGYFPSAVPTHYRRPGTTSLVRQQPGLYDLLPFLEQTVLFNSFNLSLDDESQVPVALMQNQTATRSRVTAFLCPSDSRLPAGEPGPNSYRFNVGVVPYQRYREDNSGDYLVKGAAFAAGRRFTAADFTDGLSQTVGMSERLVGSGASSFDRRRDFWYAAVADLVAPWQADQLAAICNSMVGTPDVYATKIGYSWSWASYGGTWYNHVAPPNATTPDCSAEKLWGSIDNEITHYGMVSARSWHPNGVNSLKMDGSVSFIKNEVDRSVWRDLGTRAGGELSDNP